MRFPVKERQQNLGDLLRQMRRNADQSFWKEFYLPWYSRALVWLSNRLYELRYRLTHAPVPR
jgi:hypothetical protein